MHEPPNWVLLVGSFRYTLAPSLSRLPLALPLPLLPAAHIRPHQCIAVHLFRIIFSFKKVQTGTKPGPELGAAAGRKVVADFFGNLADFCGLKVAPAIWQT